MKMDLILSRHQFHEKCSSGVTGTLTTVSIKKKKNKTNEFVWLSAPVGTFSGGASSLSTCQWEKPPITSVGGNIHSSSSRDFRLWKSHSHIRLGWNLITTQFHFFFFLIKFLPFAKKFVYSIVCFVRWIIRLFVWSRKLLPADIWLVGPVTWSVPRLHH